MRPETKEIDAMAFSIKQTKAKLQEFGVPAEQLDAAAEYFCAAHKTDLDAIKEERDALKHEAETLAAVQKELDALKNQPDDGFKAKYEKVKAEYDKYKTDTENEKALAAKKAAYTEVCKDAGLNEKGVAKALKYADWNAVELDDSGKVKDAKNHIKALKEEWAENVEFVTTRGANTPNPPANNGGTLKSREDIYKTDERGRFVMDATQRQAALAQIIAAEQQKGF